MDPNNPNPLDPADHIGIAKRIVYGSVKERLDATDKHVTFSEDEVYIVWFTFVLGNWKALLSTTLPDGMYYEVTFNNSMKEIYLDSYKKFHNTVTIPWMGF